MCVTLLIRRAPARGGNHRKLPQKNQGHPGVTTFAAVLAIAAMALVAFKLTRDPASPTPVRHQPAIRYLGVYERDAPQSYAGIRTFARTVGRQPNLVSYYSGWFEPFQTAFAEMAARNGAMTIVQIDPTDISLARIAAGGYDRYLVRFATEVAAFGRPVVISFGHEMNGYWQTWGYRHTPPADFRAAWRHIVEVFRQNGATNVKWLWQVNSVSKKTAPIREFWPGAKYVTWVGISGYYFLPGETYNYIFGRVIAQARKFTNAPILIAETGVSPGPQVALNIQNLFQGLRAQHVIGLVWFDMNKRGVLYHGGKWRLEGHSTAVRAFRDALGGT
jgi:mannan endo-1,4-beta-mannosidase